QVEGPQAAVAVAAVGATVTAQVERVDRVQLRAAQATRFQESLIGVLHRRIAHDLLRDLTGRLRRADMVAGVDDGLALGEAVEDAEEDPSAPQGNPGERLLHLGGQLRIRAPPVRLAVTGLGQLDEGVLDTHGLRTGASLRGAVGSQDVWGNSGLGGWRAGSADRDGPHALFLPTPWASAA